MIVFIYVFRCECILSKLGRNIRQIYMKYAVFSHCVRRHCKTLRNRRFRFPGSASGNAQAVLNAPLVLIVQPRKHRKVGFDDVGMKWQKLRVSRKHKD